MKQSERLRAVDNGTVEKEVSQILQLMTCTSVNRLTVMVLRMFHNFTTSDFCDAYPFF